MSKPKVVTLCGSTRFKQEFIKANFDLTMRGNIVISVGWFSHADGNTYTPTEEEKERLDELHLRKIDISDAIFVVNGFMGSCKRCGRAYQMNNGEKLHICACGSEDVDNLPYIGDSTRREVEYAEKLGKAIIYLNPI